MVTRSEDQEHELMCSTIMGGFSKRGTNVGEKVVVGDDNGVLTLWERGVWDDQDERIVLDRGARGSAETVECITKLPAGIAGNNRTLVAGMGGGLITCVQLGSNKIIDVFRHDENESVSAINFDVQNRMITGGGEIIKIWQEEMEKDESEQEAEVTNGKANGKHAADSDSESEDDDDSSEEEARRRRGKKRKKGNAKLNTSSETLGSFAGLD